MAKIGVFGGTFNPVHTGHVRLCRQCMKSLQLDSMLVIPAKIPPHKNASALAPDNDRIAMLNRAFTGLPVTVSDIECRLPGKSYTVRTLRLLKERHPDDDFYLLVGSDMLYTFEQWREYETILSLAHLVAGARQEDEYLALCEKKASFGALADRIIVLRIDVTEVSSTEIRARLAAGEQPDESQLPKEVLAYIMKRGLYQPFSEAALCTYEQAAREALHDKRFYHTQCVARLAGELAACYGADVRKARAAGFLHDITKEIPAPDQLKMIGESAIITDKSILMNPNVYHSVTGMITAQNRFGIQEADVLNAIRYHTTGRAGMSLLEKIIYTADAVSYERDYKGVETLRKDAFSDLDRTMLEIVRFTLKNLVKDCTPVAIDSVSCYNALCLRAEK